MQRRILVVFGLLGAIAGVVLLLVLWGMEGPQTALEKAVAPAAPQPAPPSDGLGAVKHHGTLRGKVVNGLPPHKPIPGAKVLALRPYLDPGTGDDVPNWGQLLTERTVVTDAAGTFAIEDLAPDYWNLWVEKRGYAWATVPRADFDTSHVIKLYPACSIRGRVVLPDGEPAPGVRIEYTPQGAASEVFSRFRLKYYYTETDEDGRFEYTDLPPGKFTVEVYPRNYLPAPWDREPPLKPGENRDLGTRKLDSGYGMEVHVKWRGTDEPVEGIEVVVRPMGDPLPRTRTGQRRRTDSRGIARFQGLGGQLMQKAQFLVAANVPGVGPVSPDQPGLWGPDSHITIYLRRSGVIKGKVVRPDGTPATHFMAKLKAIGHAQSRQLQAFGENGAFSLHLVPEGDYNLLIQAGNFINSSLNVTAIAGREVDVGTITLNQGAEIYGTVTRSGGRELKGIVRVNLARRVKNPAGHEVYELVGRSYCKKDGTYLIRGVPEGVFDLQPESLQTPASATDPERIVIGPGVGAIQKDLVLWGRGGLKLMFTDLIEEEERHVKNAETYLVEESTGKEMRWWSDGTPLRPGRYEVYVVTKSLEGVSQRYRAGAVSIQEGRTTGPMRIRLDRIRHGEPGLEEERDRPEPKGRKGAQGR